MKICTKCKIEKELSEFPFQNKEKGIYMSICRDCNKERNRHYNKNNKEKVSKQKAEYRQNNKEILLIKDKNYRDEHKEEKKEYDKTYREENKEARSNYNKKYYKENKDHKIEYQREYVKNTKEARLEYKRNWQKEREEKDINFKLRRSVSRMINNAIVNNGSSKNGSSITKYIDINLLKDHITKLFSAPENLTPDGKVWMNWSNRGKYNPKTWKDDDWTTWTWQIDHIKPISDFYFTSMDDMEFQECFAIENQRPLSAKQNLLDGVRRTRHKKQD